MSAVLGHGYCPCGRCPVERMQRGLTPSCCDRNGTSVLTTFLALTIARYPSIEAGGDYSTGDTREDMRKARTEHGRPAEPVDEWRTHLRGAVGNGRTPAHNARLADMLAIAERAR